MSQALQSEAELELSRKVARLEERVERLEELLSRGAARADSSRIVESRAPPNPQPPVSQAENPEKPGVDLEFEVGQNWFAKVGIVALAAGGAFALSLPFDKLPPYFPSLAGCGAVAILFWLSHLWRDSLDLVSRYVRGAAMAMLYMAALRLYFFGNQHLLTVDSILGKILLVLVVAANITIAYRRKSPYLLGLAFSMGYATAIAVNEPWFLLMSIAALASFAVHARLKFEAPALFIVTSCLTYLAYFNWAANNPLLARNYHFRADHYYSVYVLLGCVAILSLGCICRQDRSREDPATMVGSLVNCFLGYGVFLLHSLVFPARFPAANIAASLVFIGLAAAFWIRERSQASTFLYAMTGYMALTAAIIRMFAAPEVFVWLSLQSLVVVTTAIWFQSRFIIVANFIIYVAIGGAYVVVARRETGISLVLGVVALVSARILNWKKERLLLKTEMMRNAYLFSAFVVFPYSLYHLVPSAFVALAWVGVALFYYGMNWIVRNRKYRWLGHGTLMLTALYLFIAGTSRLDPLYRIISFFVVGAALLITSVIFTKIRRRQENQTSAHPDR